MRKFLLYSIIVAGGLVWAGVAAAQGDVREGRLIARHWCAACHATGTSNRTSDTAPAFKIIADDPARTPARLRLWLTDPHPPMPNPGLSRVEIEDVIAYIRSLKSE